MKIVNVVCLYCDQQTFLLYYSNPRDWAFVMCTVDFKHKPKTESHQTYTHTHTHNRGYTLTNSSSLVCKNTYIHRTIVKKNKKPPSCTRLTTHRLLLPSSVYLHATRIWRGGELGSSQEKFCTMFLGNERTNNINHSALA